MAIEALSEKFDVRLERRQLAALKAIADRSGYTPSLIMRAILEDFLASGRDVHDLVVQLAELEAERRKAERPPVRRESS